MPSTRLLHCLVLLWLGLESAVSFTSTRRSFRSSSSPTAATMPAATNSRVPWKLSTTTLEPPTKETTKKRRYNNEDSDSIVTDDDIRRGGPLEYLEDDPFTSREQDDPFHILLLGSTFDKPKITIPYVSNSLEYVLDMPNEEAMELSKFAKDEGMSCLGVWPREECLSLGKKLQVRDIVCRVVPYCEGGQRGWQAKDVNSGWTGSPTEI